MGGARIVIVDDEPDLAELIADYLGRHGFEARTASGGRELDRCLAEQPADLLILDINMPEEDGGSIARRIRSGSSLPIIMLTAASDVPGRVAALDGGADDYLCKPFDLRELQARIRAVLRRGPAQPPAAPAGHRIGFGEMVLDTQAHCLRRADGTVLALTAMEYDMLLAFAENPNRVLSRDRLLDLAHRGDRDPFDRSIDIRVTRLRRKLEQDPGKPAVIRTVRGIGYMFVPPPATTEG